MSTSLTTGSPEGLTAARNQGGRRETAPVNHVAPCQCPKLRNLVVCIDGTANQFSKKNSNVVELYSRLVKNDDQMTYYTSGIGTYVESSNPWFSYSAWKRRISRTIDVAIAKHFKNKVLGAYQWLSENYKGGDRIFLFGFSRGAYQVRVIAGMIEKVGLLHKGNNEQIPFAYELYIKTIEKKNHLDSKGSHDLCKRFKDTLSQPNVKVHFVGAWDTVSSVGVFKGPSLPETTAGMGHVCAFCHALALDELRVKFLPEYVNGGEGPGNDIQGAHVKEVWFSGSHSDIGGGNIPNLNLNHFGPSLRWMTYEAIQNGLKMQSTPSKWSPMSSTRSMTLKWKFFEYILPIHHLSYKDANSTVFGWHCQNARQMKQGQRIHETVFEEMNKEKKKIYLPKACTFGGIPWDKNKAIMQPLVEEDPYSKSANFFNRLENYTVKERLTEEEVYFISNLISTSEIGPRSIIDVSGATDFIMGALLAEVEDLKDSSQPRTLDQKPQDEAIFTLVKVLNTFKLVSSPTIKYRPISLEKMWSVLEQQYPDLPLKVAKSVTIGQPFFALLIGIDEYTAPEISNLQGCIEDAKDIQAVLTRDFKVSKHRVYNLYNKTATHANILKNISNIAENGYIAFNDPILIYYAGHSEMVEDGLKLLPSDYLRGDQVGISVTALNKSLVELATKKGNNITVILETSNAGAFSENNYAQGTSFDSHVLLAACSRGEFAKESQGRGIFTTNLTGLLHELGAQINRTTYQDVIQLLPPLWGQTPVCEGKHNNRILFSISELGVSKFK